MWLDQLIFCHSNRFVVILLKKLHIVAQNVTADAAMCIVALLLLLALLHNVSMCFAESVWHFREHVFAVHVVS